MTEQKSRAELATEITISTMERMTRRTGSLEEDIKCQQQIIEEIYATAMKAIKANQ